MKRRLAAAILTATVTAGAVTLPAAAEWDRGEQDTTACVETVGTPQGTGWQQIGGVWYLITKEGNYYQGWHREKGQWYFLNNRGAMVTGWVEIDGRVYCFGAAGVLMTGTACSGDQCYQLGLDGAVVGEEVPAVSQIYITIAGIVRAVA